MPTPIDPSALDWTKLRSVGAGTTHVLPVAVQDVESGTVLVAYPTCFHRQLAVPR
jgi:hypothetical protein